MATKALKQRMASKILRATDDNIEKAAQVIKKGGLVIFPTDTVYGLGCDAFNAEAVRRIFAVKGRDEKKPLPVLIADLAQLKKIVKKTPPLAKELIKKHWPGKLTIVFHKNEKMSPEITAGGEKIGVRMPRQRIVEQLIKMANRPIIGTSANLSGEGELRKVNDIPAKLLEGVDLVLDGGESESSIPSTVIDVTVKPPQILRQGAIFI